MKKNGEYLSELLERAVLVGEEPYQANRRAVRNLDVLEEVGRGRSELNNVLSGLVMLKGNLEEVKDAARVIARNASSFL